MLKVTPLYLSMLSASVVTCCVSAKTIAQESPSVVTASQELEAVDNEKPITEIEVEIEADIEAETKNAIRKSDVETRQAARQEKYHQGDEVIVVTGTRAPKLLSNSPVKVEVIEQEQIGLLTQGTIAQALNFIPGVVVTRSQKDGYNVQMQGFDGDNVLILVDSQPLVSPTGGAVDLDQISAQNILQIEVIRGAASVMYGSQAMGGVINIITAQPEQNQFLASYEVGSYTQNAIEDSRYAQQARVNAAFVSESWKHQFSSLFTYSPGYDYDNDSSSVPAGELDKTFFNWSSVGEFDLLKAGFKYQYFNEIKDKPVGKIPGQSTLMHYLSDVDQHQLDINLANLPLDLHNTTKAQAINTWQVNGRAMQHDEYSGRSGSRRQTDIGLYEINGQYLVSYKDLEIVSGGLIHQDTIEQIKVKSNTVEVPDTSRESVEAYSQVNWINDESQYLVGFRMQYDSDFGDHYALRASGMNDLLTNEKGGFEKLKWRYAIGQGYRVPTLKERYFEFDHSALGYKVYGNQDLAPETSVTANTSLNYQNSIDDSLLGSFDLTVDGNVFYTVADNLIDTFTDPERSAQENLDVSVYGNIQEATLKGFDLSTSMTYSQWQTQLNYSFLSAKDQGDQRLENRPKHQIKTSLGYTPTNIDLNAMLYLVYQANEAVPSDKYRDEINNSWVTVDFKLSHQLTKHYSWRLTLDNIFNTHQDSAAAQQQVFDARPVSSRYFSVGITYQL